MRRRRGRGEGSVYERADGLWACSLSQGTDGSGKRRRVIVTGATKKEVLDTLKQLHQKADQGMLLDTDRLTVGEYLGQWIETIKTAVAPNTWIQYEQHVRLHLTPHLGQIRLSKLTALQIERLFADLHKAGESTTQQRKVGTTLSVALSRASKLRLIAYNPYRDATKPRASKTERPLWTVDQLSQFLDATSGDRLSAMYLLAVDGGLRQGELFGLQWGDFDLDAGTVTVVRSLEEVSLKSRKSLGAEEEGRFRLKEIKTAKGRRTIALAGRTIAALREHRRQALAEGHISGPVFCDSQGGFLRKSNVVRRSFLNAIGKANYKINQEAAKAGVEPERLPVIRFNDLRHLCATFLLANGENIKVISDRLGHTNVQITLDTYAHGSLGLQQQAAERMERILGREKSVG